MSAEIPEEAVAAVYGKLAAIGYYGNRPLREVAADIAGAAWPGFVAAAEERTAGMAEALERAEAIIEDRDRQLAEARAAERERLFVAIRHKIPLSQPWRGEALDLIYEVWRETDG
jgi:hypothetical protein